METNAELTYRTYEPEARAHARGIRPQRNRVDLLAMDQEDYRQEFQLEATKAAFRYQSRFGFCLPAEKRYAKAAIWNMRMSWTRDYTRVAKALDGPPASLDMVRGREDLIYSEDNRFEARSILRLLDRHLSDHDKGVLRALAAAGGSIAKAWEHSESTAKLTSFENGVARLRKRARKLIEKSAADVW